MTESFETRPEQEALTTTKPFDQLIKEATGGFERDILHAVRLLFGNEAANRTHEKIVKVNSDPTFNKVAGQAKSAAQTAADKVRTTDFNKLYNQHVAPVVNPNTSIGLNKMKENFVTPIVDSLNSTASRKVNEWLDSDDFGKDLTNAGPFANDSRVRDAYRKLVTQRIQSISADDVLAALPEDQSSFAQPQQLPFEDSSADLPTTNVDSKTSESEFPA